MGLAEDYTKSKVKAIFTKVYILIFRRKKMQMKHSRHKERRSEEAKA
jgi:hypothetical protein